MDQIDLADQEMRIDLLDQEVKVDQEDRGHSVLMEADQLVHVPMEMLLTVPVPTHVETTPDPPVSVLMDHLHHLQLLLILQLVLTLEVQQTQ